MVSLLLVLVTLMQRPKQEGLGAAFGGGMMNDTFGAQTTDVLQKGTVWLTIAFFGSAIILTILNTRYYESQRDVGNILEEVQKPEAIPSFPAPGTFPPAIPATETPAAKSDGTKSDATPKAAAKKATTEKASSKDAKPAKKADAGKDKSADAKKAPAKAIDAKADAPKAPAEQKDKK